MKYTAILSGIIFLLAVDTRIVEYNIECFNIHHKSQSASRPDVY